VRRLLLAYVLIDVVPEGLTEGKAALACVFAWARQIRRLRTARGIASSVGVCRCRISARCRINLDRSRFLARPL